MKDLKEKNFRRVYLFYGEERYLVKLYEHKMRDSVADPGAELMNTDVLDGPNFSVEAVVNAAETLPFLSEKRLVIVRDSGLFAPGKKNESDRMAD